MSIICTWKPCDCYEDEREEIDISEEDWENIQALQQWWAKNGERITNEYYGIESIEPNGDLVLRDIDDYLEKLHWSGDWLPGEEEEEERVLRELIPNWDNLPDMGEIIRKEKEAKKADEERRSKISVTTKLVRPKKEEVAESEGKPKRTRKSKKKEQDTLDLLKHNAMKVAVESILKLLDDEVETKKEEKKSKKKNKSKGKEVNDFIFDDFDFGDDED